MITGTENAKELKNMFNHKNDNQRKDGVIKVIAGDRFTPFALARKLNAKVILESSSFKKGKERYSLLLIREAFKVLQKNGKLLLEQEGNVRQLRDTQTRDILDVLLSFAREHPPLHQDIPLPAGGIGFLSYEFAKYCDDIVFRSKENSSDLPEACFIFGHIFVIFDHYTDIIYLVGLNYREHEIDLNKALAETEAKLNDLDFNYLSPERERQIGMITADEEDKEQFCKGVEKIKEEIVKGNLLQAVLSRRMTISSDITALQVYKNLRSTNPSPYLFYLDFGDFQLFGSSPEMHVKVKNEVAGLHPIAGTRRRGANPSEDAELAKELKNDEKERAEHLMLVDLAGNDLGRFCLPGSVEVTQFMEVEHYSHVMHLVSRVQGKVKPNITGVDAIRATFPAGTVTGAPKIQAIKTIDQLENEERGFYAGLVGYMEPEGNVDTCITIRSGLKKGEKLILQAGAGVVYDSKPEREYEETIEKIRALASAVGMEV